MATGRLQISTFLAQQALSVPNVLIRVFKQVEDEIVFEKYLITNEEGLSEIIELETVSRLLSLDESNTLRPYETYSVEISLAGYQTFLIQGVQIFEDELSEIPIEMIPTPGRETEFEVDTIPDHHLLTNAGNDTINRQATRQFVPFTPDYRFYEDEDIRQPERIEYVLKGVVIPRRIRVHLGRPTSNAENVSCDFIYYIKNVCSSEIYPTWPRQALLANIHAQVSLALNRIYTEWYPSKGYDFDITNNTAFDQAFVKNRNIYESVSQIVDEVFNQYLRKLNYSEPFYAEYCDGRIAQCPGMKQWGTLTLANQGLSAIQILQRYYTTNVRLVTSERIEDVKGSYPGTPLRIGSSGDDVHLLQQQLNAIAVNYPAIPVIYPIDGIYGEQTAAAVRIFQRQFSLTVDGVVGKSTWYKINYIYLAVRKLAELTSIGRVEGLNSGEWPGVTLRQGDRSLYVQQLQYYLQTIASFNNAIYPIKNIDSYFGNDTYQAVVSFQRAYSLTRDGIVGMSTWNRIFEVYSDYEQVVNPDDQAPVYPGTALRIGSSGADVLAIQDAINIVNIESPSIPILVEDGIFGENTRNAVIQFQRLYNLDADGIVGQLTWNKLFEIAYSITNGNSVSPAHPPYPGTVLRLNSRGEAVKLIQQRLNFISIYYPSIPTVTVDGVYGPNTQRAVEAFQRLLGLNVDGITGRTTWNKIMQINDELNG